MYLGAIPFKMSSTWEQWEQESFNLRGDSSCSWVFFHALDPVMRKELQAITLGGRWNLDGESGGSSTFAVNVKIVLPGGTCSLWRIQTLSLSTAFIDYSWDWLSRSSVVPTQPIYQSMPVSNFQTPLKSCSIEPEMIQAQFKGILFNRCLGGWMVKVAGILIVGWCCEFNTQWRQFFFCADFETPWCQFCTRMTEMSDLAI